MDVITKKMSLTSLTERLKSEGKRVGFVPTMGALHAGHISLVKACKQANDITIASIFVNPTQFNDKDDLARYPRSPEQDIALLKESGCDYAFIPSVEEIYPEEETRTFHFGYIENVMEGAKRPGHFNGVAQVVSRLFDIVSPHRAYFGQKDFQQVAIVRRLVQQLHYNIEIVTCPIVREPDGLAMSSRNLLLTPEQRANASHIYQTLQKSTRMIASFDVEELKAWVIQKINENPCLETDYFDIVDNIELRPVRSWQENNVKVGCVAVYAGKIRLIDNITIGS
jgi:pantoate--beta-alanine ligase